MIEGDRCEKSLDRLRRLLHGGEAMPALLVQPAEARMMPLEVLELCQRGVDAAKASLGDGHEQQRIAMIGRCVEQPFTRRDCLRELLLPDERA